MFLHKYFRLNRTERGLIARSLILLGCIRLGFLFFPYPWMRRMLSRALVLKNGDHPNKIPFKTIIWAVKIGSRYVPGGKHCLTKALVTQILLCQKGYPSNLRIGVCRKKGEKLEAHAWLECEGKIVIGGLPDLSRYIPLTSGGNGIL